MMKLQLPDYSFFEDYNYIEDYGKIPKNKDFLVIIKKLFPFIKISLNKPNPFSYDGLSKQLFIGDCDVMGAFHEVAHYLISPKKRLKCNDFGLGQGFNSEQDSKLFVPSKKSSEEEELACFLEWILAYNLINNKSQKTIKKYIYSTMELENFYKFDMSDYKKYKQRLLKYKNKLKNDFKIQIITNKN